MTDSVVENNLRARRIARVGMIAAAYAAASLVALMFLGGLAWGPYNSVFLKPFACWRSFQQMLFLVLP